VNDIERAADIASSKDVRLGGLHAFIDDDLRFVQRDFGCFEIQTARRRLAARLNTEGA